MNCHAYEPANNVSCSTPNTPLRLTSLFGMRSVGRIQPVAPRAHDDLPHPVGRVRRTTRRLRAEALIVAHVRVDDQVGSRSIEVVPERLGRVGGPGAAGGRPAKPGPLAPCACALSPA